MTDPSTRIERDSFGPIEVPADRLWGAQTQRSLEHFRISTEKMPEALIRALLDRQALMRARQREARLVAATDGGCHRRRRRRRRWRDVMQANFRSRSGRPDRGRKRT